MQNQSSEFKSEQNTTAAAEPQPGQALSAKRRSTRLQVAIPIILHWQDESGISHAEKAFTLMVSRHGAEIAAPTKLNVGMEIEVENHGLKRSAKCQVVWTRGRRSPNSPYEAGLALLSAEDIWGVKFPPQDWGMGESAQNSELQKGAAAPAATGAPAHAEVASAVSSSTEKAEALHPPESIVASSAAQGEGVPAEPAAEMTNFATHRLRQAQDEAAAEAAESALRERLERGAEEIGQLVAEARERAQKYWEERKQEADSLVAQSVNSAASALRQTAEDAARNLQGGADNLRAEYARLAEDAARARAEISSSLAEELRNRDELKRAAEEFGKARAEVSTLLADGQRTQNDLKQAAEDAARVRAEAADSLAESQRTRDDLKQAADEAAKARAEFSALLAEGQRSKEDLQKAQEELQAKLSDPQWKRLEELTQQVARGRAEMEGVAERTLGSLRHAGDDAMVRLNAETNKVKEDLEQLAAEYRTSLSESSASLQDGFRHYLDLQVDVWKTETHETVKGIKEAALEELRQGLQAAADATLESASGQLHRQVEDARDLLGKELTDSRLAAMEEAKRQFASEGQQLMEASRSLANELRGAVKAAADETEARVQAVSQRAIETIQAENARQGDAWRESAEGVFQKAAEKELCDFQSRLHEALGAVQGPVLEEVEKQAQEMKERAVKDASNAIHQQIGLGAVVLKDWADQATARLERSFQQQMAEFEKRLAEGSRAMIEQNRRETESGVDALRRRLLEAARLLERSGE